MAFRLCGTGLLALILLLQTACASDPKPEPQYAAFAIFPPLQSPMNKEEPVLVGRTSILWGSHDYVQGADVSLIGNFVNKEFRGSAGSLVFHSTSGKARIFAGQFSGVANFNHGDTKIEGFQFATAMNYAGGPQKVYGAQVGALNVGKKNKVYGFQIGAYNQAEAIYGFQIGVLNRTKTLYGIQIGLLNFSGKNGLPFCPVVNIGF